MKKILTTRLSVCSLGVSCNDIIDTPMLLVVQSTNIMNIPKYSIGLLIL